METTDVVRMLEEILEAAPRLNKTEVTLRLSSIEASSNSLEPKYGGHLVRRACISGAEVFSGARDIENATAFARADIAKVKSALSRLNQAYG